MEGSSQNFIYRKLRKISHSHTPRKITQYHTRVLFFSIPTAAFVKNAYVDLTKDITPYYHTPYTLLHQYDIFARPKCYHTGVISCATLRYPKALRPTQARGVHKLDHLDPPLWGQALALTASTGLGGSLSVNIVGRWEMFSVAARLIVTDMGFS